MNTTSMIEFISQPWPWYVAGPAIGLMVPLLLIVLNKSFRVSSSLKHLCAMCSISKANYFKYNWKKDPFFNPIPVGFNIIGFDMIIINRLCKEYGPFDDARQQQKIFSKIHKCDVMDNMHMWTEGDPSIRSISMDTLRERMGLSTENAHDALQDVKDTANIFIKLLKTHRAVYQNIEFDKAFADGNLYVK